jgi:chemotaxis protein methyltransferase CheR
MSSPLSPELLRNLSVFVAAELGLNFPADRWPELGRAVTSAALELGVSDLPRWVAALSAGQLSPTHLKAAANHLTISETYFFRQPESFAALEEDILPARLRRRQADAKNLRIWSAGCASGEEPFSIAILLRRAFPLLPAANVTIIGTDLNSQVLARAERGVYSEWSFRDAPAWLKSLYFTLTPQGRYEIIPAIRAMVHFSQVNFAMPIYPVEFGDQGDFDVILCRNVLMYFSSEWQEKIIRRLRQAMAPGGWLLVGPCDVSSALCAELQLQSTGPGVFFAPAPGSPRRVAAAPVPAVAPPPLWLPRPLEAAVPTPTPAAAPVSAGEEAGASARQHADRGDLPEALVAAEKAIADDPMNPNLHYLRGCILMELDRLPEAIAALRRVLYLEPASVMAEFTLGSVAERVGRTDDARHHFGRVRQLIASHHREETVPRSEGLTVGRLREVVDKNLAGTR